MTTLLDDCEECVRFVAEQQAHNDVHGPHPDCPTYPCGHPIPRRPHGVAKCWKCEPPEFYL